MKLATRPAGPPEGGADWAEEQRRAFVRRLGIGAVVGVLVLGISVELVGPLVTFEFFVFVLVLIAGFAARSWLRQRDGRQDEL